MRFNKKIDVELDITPEDAALIFCRFNEQQQASFFEAIAKDVKENWGVPFSVQMDFIAIDGNLSREALSIVKDIGGIADV